MNFDDQQLQTCFERNFAEVSGASDEIRQVSALIAAHDLFHMLEGPHSSKVHETIWHLLLPKLRPSLRAWYQRSPHGLTSTGMGLRDHLSQMAGEQLGFAPKLPLSASTILRSAKES